jgi:hypothetical protein
MSSPITKDQNDFTNRFIEISNICLLIISFYLIFNFVKYAQYGIDFTDEGFYLNWNTHPYNYSATVTMFGFIYNPIFYLLSNNIYYTRLFNLFFTFTLSTIFIYNLLINLYNSKKYNILTISIVFSYYSLFSFNHWLVTPNYNTLAFQGILIFLTGIVINHKNIENNYFQTAILSIGFILTLFAKPSSAFILFVIFSINLLKHKNKINNLFIVLIISILIYIPILIQDRSPMVAVYRILDGIDIYKTLTDEHINPVIFRFDDFFIYIENLKIMAIIFIINFTGLILFSKDNKIFQSVYILSITVINYLIFFKYSYSSYELTDFYGLIIFSIIFSNILFLILKYKDIDFKTISFKDKLLILILFLMPHIYSFGTTRNYWENGSSVGIFWLLASIILMKPYAIFKQSWTFLFPTMLSITILGTILLNTIIANPYRQVPLWENSVLVNTGAKNSYLYLTQSQANLINSARSISASNGFKADTPMIDLTGQSPGLLYLLMARSVGFPWLAGGYKGSTEFAQKALASETCDLLSKSWILSEPEGTRKLPPTILSDFGSDLKLDYEIITTWQNNSRLQILYKPLNSEIVKNKCIAIRENIKLN